MKKNIWRLSTQPTVDEITTLLEKKVITNEEAKDMLFRGEDEKKPDHNELKEIKDELKLLRELVLSRIDNSQTVIIKKYYDEWYHRPYFPSWTNTYCSSTGLGTTTTGGSVTFTGNLTK